MMTNSAISKLTTASTILALMAMHPGRLSAQEPEENGPQAASSDAYLGVIVGPSPTRGVFVRDVAAGSAAAEAGIRPGDYILSIAGEEISSPQRLSAALQEHAEGRPVSVAIWRNNREMSREVTLQQRPERLRAKGWLGVRLLPDEAEGVRIVGVVAGGPADKAGLKAGDRLLRIDGRTVATPGDVVALIEEISPGSQAEIAVLRGEHNQSMDVTIGRKTGRPGRYGRDPYGSRYRDRYYRRPYGYGYPYPYYRYDRYRRRPYSYYRPYPYGYGYRRGYSYYGPRRYSFGYWSGPFWFEYSW